MTQGQGRKWDILHQGSIVKAIELNKCYKYEEISPVGDGNNGGDRSRDEGGQIGKSRQRYGGKLPDFLKGDPVS